MNAKEHFSETNVKFTSSVPFKLNYIAVFFKVKFGTFNMLFGTQPRNLRRTVTLTRRHGDLAPEICRVLP